MSPPNGFRGAHNPKVAGSNPAADVIFRRRTNRASANPETRRYAAPMAAQLTRSKTDRVIAGVAGGIAERFGLDPTLVRIAWVVSIFFGGFGILLYVVLWIALPEGSAQASAIRIAEERYARGEISTEELRRIRDDLQSPA